jgi:hypothetical protein
MLAREQLKPKLVVRFLVALRSYIGRNTLVWLELAAEGHHCAVEVALLLALAQGTIGKECLKRCAS